MNKTHITGILFSIFILLLYFGIGENSDFSHKMFLYWNGQRANNNHNNWACHNYAHNLMKTAEPNSIFMTEGGDNQVFSLLYFSYAEEKRPDVDFFDQKGNVFPRLYGDLMNTQPWDLDIIRDLRDFELYSTGRPVYLTWRREGLEKINIERIQDLLDRVKNKWGSQGYAHIVKSLEQKWKNKLTSVEAIRQTLKKMVPLATFDRKMKHQEHLNKQHLRYLGPWYFKTYGILYKVTPIRYAIVDGLEIYKISEKETLKAFVKKVSAIDLREDQFQQYISELEKEGYLKSIANNRYQLVKPLENPYPNLSLEDYWDGYRMDYTNIANSRHWDNLTREIFSSYNNQKANFYLEERQLLADKILYSQLPVDKNDYEQRQNLYLTKALDYYQKTTYYNNAGYLFFNYANALARFGREHEAVIYYEKASKAEKDLYQGYLNIANHYENKIANSSAAQEYQLIDTATTYLNLAKKNMERVGRKKNQNVKNDPNYKKLEFLIKKNQAMKENPKTKLEEIKAIADQKGDIASLQQLYFIYNQRMQYNKAANTMTRIISLDPYNYLYYVEKYNSLEKLDSFIAVQALEEMYQKIPQLTNAPQASQLNIGRSIAIKYYLIGNEVARKGDFTRALSLFEKSKNYFENFKVEATSLLGNQTIKKMVIEAEKVINDINQKMQAFQRMQG